MFTVGDLLRIPELQTISLTPGVGEYRPVSWAHVCELAEPWQWIGGNALVMTTGIPVPVTAAAQCAYVEKMVQSGITAIAIGENMSAPPLTPEMLERAKELEFPILETAHGQPFITLALAVADANHRERQQRIRSAEELYQSLLNRTDSSSISHLLGELSHYLGGELSIHGMNPGTATLPRGQIRRETNGAYAIALPIADNRELQLVPNDGEEVDYALLQHAATIVSGVLATQSALNRQQWLQGSILLAGLFDESIPIAAAEELVAAYDVKPPYALAACVGPKGASGIELVGNALNTAEIPALLTINEGRLNILAGDGPDLVRELQELSESLDCRVAMSESFNELKGLTEAKLQTILTLTDSRSNGLTRFKDRVSDLPFMPTESASRKRLANQVLGSLIEYDSKGRSSLIRTLYIFLAENRSWVRASERLFVHRQTLVSRISKIEQLTGNSFSSTSDVAVLWFALQCAIEEGILEPE